MRTGLIFVHGILSSGETWNTLLDALSPESLNVDVIRYEYPSNLTSFKPGTRLPNIDTLAESFKTFVDLAVPQDKPLIIIAHSQGGLIVQRYLAQEVGAARGSELLRIRSILLLACPNAGSEYLLSLRKAFGIWKHPQESELRPLTEAIARTQRVVLERVVYAQGSSDTFCQIPVYAYAGETDNIVVPASARAVFPQGGVLPGDHNGIIRPKGRDSLVCVVIRRIVGATGAAVDVGATQAGAPQGDANDSERIAWSSEDGLSRAVDASRGHDNMARLKTISDILLRFDEFADEVSRRQIVLFLPPYIRNSVLASGPVRMQVISIVRAFVSYEDAGRRTLANLFELVFDPADPRVTRALAAIEEAWPDN